MFPPPTFLEEISIFDPPVVASITGPPRLHNNSKAYRKDGCIERMSHRTVLPSSLTEKRNHIALSESIATWGRNGSSVTRNIDDYFMKRKSYHHFTNNNCGVRALTFFDGAWLKRKISKPSLDEELVLSKHIFITLGMKMFS